MRSSILPLACNFLDHPMNGVFRSAKYSTRSPSLIVMGILSAGMANPKTLASCLESERSGQGSLVSFGSSAHRNPSPKRAIEEIFTNCFTYVMIYQLPAAQVLPLVTGAQVVHDADRASARCLQPGHDVRADEARSSSDYNHGVKLSHLFWPPALHAFGLGGDREGGVERRDRKIVSNRQLQICCVVRCQSM